MDLILSVDGRGMYVLTEKLPVRAEVDGTGRDDLYIVPDDGLGLRHLCPGGVEMIFGGNLRLKRFQCVEVRLVGTICGEVMEVAKQ